MSIMYFAISGLSTSKTDHRTDCIFANDNGSLDLLCINVTKNQEDHHLVIFYYFELFFKKSHVRHLLEGGKMIVFKGKG